MSDFLILLKLMRLVKSGVAIGTAYTEVAKLGVDQNKVIDIYLRTHNEQVKSWPVGFVDEETIMKWILAL